MTGYLHILECMGQDVKTTTTTNETKQTKRKQWYRLNFAVYCCFFYVFQVVNLEQQTVSSRLEVIKSSNASFSLGRILSYIILIIP